MGYRQLVKREKNFLTELRNSFRQSGAFFHKISDSFHGGGIRFDLPKPFDAFACYRGVPIAIEAKVITDYKAFGKTFLRDCQTKGLTEWCEAGGRSYVFLNIRRTGKKDAKISRVNRLLIFDWEMLAWNRNMRKQEIEEYPYIIGKNGLFNLRPWFDGKLTCMKI